MNRKGMEMIPAALLGIIIMLVIFGTFYGFSSGFFKSVSVDVGRLTSCGGPANGQCMVECEIGSESIGEYGCKTGDQCCIKIKGTGTGTGVPEPIVAEYKCPNTAGACAGKDGVYVGKGNAASLKDFCVYEKRKNNYPADDGTPGTCWLCGNDQPRCGIPGTTGDYSCPANSSAECKNRKGRYYLDYLKAKPTGSWCVYKRFDNAGNPTPTGTPQGQCWLCKSPAECQSISTLSQRETEWVKSNLGS
jgi:hypothetical protein